MKLPVWADLFIVCKIMKTNLKFIYYLIYNQLNQLTWDGIVEDDSNGNLGD